MNNIIYVTKNETQVRCPDEAMAKSYEYEVPCFTPGTSLSWRFITMIFKIT